MEDKYDLEDTNTVIVKDVSFRHSGGVDFTTITTTNGITIGDLAVDPHSIVAIDDDNVVLMRRMAICNNVFDIMADFIKVLK
jgi:hypothetical protein